MFICSVGYARPRVQKMKKQRMARPTTRLDLVATASPPSSSFYVNWALSPLGADEIDDRSSLESVFSLIVVMWAICCGVINAYSVCEKVFFMRPMTAGEAILAEMSSLI